LGNKVVFTCDRIAVVIRISCANSCIRPVPKSDDGVGLGLQSSQPVRMTGWVHPHHVNRGGRARVR